MNNRGFTLIELILVIALLSLIAIISTPNIIKVIKKNKVDNYNGTIDSIEKAADLYVSNNRYELKFKNELGKDDFCKPTDSSDKEIIASIFLDNLIESKDISTPVKNFCTDEDINVNTVIKIILNCGTRQFSYDIDEESSNDTLKRRSNGEIPVTGIDGIKIEDGNYCESLYQ